MGNDTRIIGLTGGIGAGKSAAADWFSAAGIPVVDTDHLARELVRPGQPALAEIVGEFGPGMLAADGSLRRDQLAARVFGDPAARSRLESILHPRIRGAWESTVADWRSAGVPVGVVVIPLLFETQAEKAFDAVVCLACSAATQERRLRERGWSADEIAGRLAAQWPLQRKADAAQYVVWNEGTREALGDQLAMVLRLVSPGRAGSAGGGTSPGSLT